MIKTDATSFSGRSCYFENKKRAVNETHNNSGVSGGGNNSILSKMKKVEHSVQDNAATTIARYFKGYFVRKNIVKVESIMKNAILTTITGSHFLSNQSNHPLGNIRLLVKDGAVYHKVRIAEKDQHLTTTSHTGKPISPYFLARKTEGNAILVNGGFFVFSEEQFVENEGFSIRNIGRPVGPMVMRSDHVDIPLYWKGDYANVINNDGDILFTSGPMLAKDGRLVIFDEHERLQYRIQSNSPSINSSEENAVIENPLNTYAGALTHCSEPNERAALTVHNVHGKREIIFHTLTAFGVRSSGVTMQEWQKITCSSSRDADRVAGAQCLITNLDGGESTFLAVKKETNIKIIAKGGAPDKRLRPLPYLLLLRE